jgi:hypothetical protein
MKKSINRQKKYNNKNKKYRNNRIINNNTPYQYSSKSQTLGVGKTSVRVTRFYTLTEDLSYNDFIIDIMDDSVSSPEFVRMATDYTYAKLKLVTITISPRTMNTTSMNFFKLDWYNSDPTDVRYDDNAKLIYTNVTYPKIYRFRPPNVLLNLGSKWFNYNEWLISNQIKNTQMPGCLKVTSMPEFTFQVETKWVFRGLNSIAPNNNKTIKVLPKASHKDETDEIIFDLKRMACKLDKIEEKEEEDKKKEKDM